MNLLTYALTINIILFPFEGLSIFGLPIVRTTGYLVILVFFLKILLSPSQDLNIKKAHIYFYLVINLLIILSLLNDNSINYAGLIISIGMIANLTFFIIFVNQVDHPSLFKKIFLPLCLSFIIATVLSIFFGSSIGSTEMVDTEDIAVFGIVEKSYRLEGFLNNPNRYAYLALIVFWIGVLFNKFKLTSQKLSLFIIFFASISVFFTLSRAAIVGLVVGYIYLFLTSTNKIAFSIFATIGLSFFISINSLILPSNSEESYFENLIQRFDRSTLTDSNSSISRKTKWISAIEEIDKKPLQGSPMGAFDKKRAQNGYKIHDPHNAYLFLWQYLGIGGLILIITFFSWIFLLLISKNHSFLVKAYVVGITSSIGIFNVFHNGLTWKATLLMFCIIVCLKHFSKMSYLEFNNQKQTTLS